MGPENVLVSRVSGRGWKAAPNGNILEVIPFFFRGERMSGLRTFRSVRGVVLVSLVFVLAAGSACSKKKDKKDDEAKTSGEIVVDAGVSGPSGAAEKEAPDPVITNAPPAPENK